MYFKLGNQIIVGRTSRTDLKGIQSLHHAFPSYPVIIIDYDDIINHPLFTQHQQAHSNNTTALPLHLKSMCSMGGDSNILLGGTPYASILQQLIQRPKPNLILQPLKSDLHTPKDSDYCSNDNDYTFTHLPYEVSAANVLYINNTIIRRTSNEFPLSEAIFRSAEFSGSAGSATATQIQVEASELAKVDGALTCCSLLLKY